MTESIILYQTQLHISLGFRPYSINASLDIKHGFDTQILTYMQFNTQLKYNVVCELLHIDVLLVLINNNYFVYIRYIVRCEIGMDIIPYL